MATIIIYCVFAYILYTAIFVGYKTPDVREKRILGTGVILAPLSLPFLVGLLIAGELNERR